jgi:hypothetical protein
VGEAGDCRDLAPTKLCDFFLAVRQHCQGLRSRMHPDLLGLGERPIHTSSGGHTTVNLWIDNAVAYIRGESAKFAYRFCAIVSGTELKKIKTVAINSGVGEIVETDSSIVADKDRKTWSRFFAKRREARYCR